jgi:ABC-type multidrug transport system permease subunit
MLDSIVELFPAEWRGAIALLLAPLRWVAHWQIVVLRAVWHGGGGSPIALALAAATVLMPVLLVVAGTWCTTLSLYTLPFRSGRGRFLTALLLAWWDAGRCIWLFWTGMVRVGVALVGWIVGSVRFALLMLKSLVVGLVRSPLAVLAVPVAVLTGLAFAAPMCAFTATQRNDQGFSAIFRFGLTPLFLFSGTFFPIEQLPELIRPIAWLTPLWHGADLVRSLSLGRVDVLLGVVHLAVLGAFVAVGIAAALVTFRRALVK